MSAALCTLLRIEGTFN